MRMNLYVAHIPYEWFWTKACFDTEAKENSEVAFWRGVSVNESCQLLKEQFVCNDFEWERFVRHHNENAQSVMYFLYLAR